MGAIVTTRCAVILALAALCACSQSNADDPSTCYGTTSDGRLENGQALPSSGANFTAYSHVGRMMGRTYVHSAVATVVLEAYAEMEKTLPGTVFVYGETGKKNGGPFDPHKTHRNGLSVDFMVPVLNEDKESVSLPTSVFNKWGYGLEFNDKGKLDELQIDFRSIAEHVYQLHQAANNHGGDLWRVILAPELQPFLQASNRWAYLEKNIEFSSKRSWVRHDEHYHVDFAFECEPVTWLPAAVNLASLASRP